MTKRKIIFAHWLVLLFSLILPCTVSAQGPKAKAMEYSRVQKEELLCQQIQDKTKNRQEIRKIVKTGIQMGYNACRVIHCSIKGGADLKEVIAGAIEGGATADVVSKCALNACVEAKDIASISGQYSAKPLDSLQAQKEGPLCMQILEKMKNRQEIREIVKTSIQISHDACGVIRCSVKGGAQVSQVIAGAIDAGYPIDIAARCIFETCSKDVAFIINNIAAPGICYVLPEDPEFIVTPLADVTKGGALLSPSGF